MKFEMIFFVLLVVLILSLLNYSFREAEKTETEVHWCLEQNGIPILKSNGNFRVCLSSDSAIERN